MHSSDNSLARMYGALTWVYYYDDELQNTRVPGYPGTRVQYPATQV